MTQEVLVPNLLQGMQRPGWSNTDLLHMYQVLTQVDHLLRWGNGLEQKVVKSTISKSGAKTRENKEQLNMSDLNEMLDTLERLSMDGRSSGVGSNSDTSKLIVSLPPDTSKPSASTPATDGTGREEEVDDEEDDEEEEDDDDEEDDKEADEEAESDKSDDPNDPNRNHSQLTSFEAMLVRCRACRSGRNHRADQCKRCARSLIKMRKRMMKKSSRLVRRIVRTHRSTISRLFSQPNMASEQQSLPLDQHLHDRLQFHLQQLTNILDAFSESAEQITQRYQTIINA